MKRDVSLIRIEMCIGMIRDIFEIEEFWDQTV